MSTDSTQYLFLRSILESPKGIIIFSLDKEYRYTVFTRAHAQAMQAIWGIAIEVGMSMLDCIGSDEDRQKAQKNFDRALGGEYLVEMEEYGDVDLSRTHWENRYSPLYDHKGDVIGLTVFVTDKTEQKKAEDRLREMTVLREVLRERDMLLNGLGEGVFGIDEKGVCFFVNPAALDILGYGTEDFVGSRPLEMIHSPRQTSCTKSSGDIGYLLTTRSLSRFDGSEWLRTKHGHLLPVRLIATPIIRDHGYAGSIIAFNDITMQHRAEQALREKNAQLSQEANSDPLTKCHNRRFLDECGQEIWMTCRAQRSPLSVIALDIDFFKKINDGHGHAAGDAILTAIAEVLRLQVRTGDIVIRTGGEEFSIILPHTPLHNASVIAERIRGAVASTAVAFKDENLSCTISLGVAARSGADACLADTMRHADTMLYRAKERGRDRVVSQHYLGRLRRG